MKKSGHVRLQAIAARRVPSTARWFWLVPATAVAVVCVVGVGAIRAADEAADDVPASQREPEAFWRDKLVVQTRGWVLAQGDDDHIIRKEFWRLGPSAIGRVTALRADGMAIVEFENDTGWERQGFEEREVRTQRWDAEVDQYGRPVAVRMRESIKEGVQVEPGDHGHLLEVGENGKRRVVRFPLNCLGLAPPTSGARVVPGPDMHSHEKLGLKGDVGTVVGIRDADHYIRVRWESTGREKVHRFDCRRHYDVVPAPAVTDVPQSR